MIRTPSFPSRSQVDGEFIWRPEFEEGNETNMCARCTKSPKVWNFHFVLEFSRLALTSMGLTQSAECRIEAITILAFLNACNSLGP